MKNEERKKSIWMNRNDYGLRRPSKNYRRLKFVRRDGMNKFDKGTNV
jgi:hypothetical protein